LIRTVTVGPSGLTSAKGGFSLDIQQDQYGSQSTSLFGDDPGALGGYIPDYLLPLFSDITAAIAPPQ